MHTPSIQVTPGTTVLVRKYIFLGRRVYVSYALIYYLYLGCTSQRVVPVFSTWYQVHLLYGSHDGTLVRWAYKYLYSYKYLYKYPELEQQNLKGLGVSTLLQHRSQFMYYTTLLYSVTNETIVISALKLLIELQ